MNLPKRSQAGAPPPQVGHAVEIGQTIPGVAFRPAVPTADPGTVVEVTWPEEVFQPFPYTSYRVGPFKATGATRPGESVPEAVMRLWGELNAAALVVREATKRSYLAAAEQLVGEVNRR